MGKNHDKISWTTENFFFLIRPPKILVAPHPWKKWGEKEMETLSEIQMRSVLQGPGGENRRQEHRGWERRFSGGEARAPPWKQSEKVTCNLGTWHETEVVGQTLILQSPPCLTFSSSTFHSHKRFPRDPVRVCSDGVSWMMVIAFFVIRVNMPVFYTEKSSSRC